MVAPSTADPQIILRAITMVMAAGTLISAAECLVNHSAMKKSGVLSWPLLRTRRRIWSHPWIVRLAAPVLGYPGVIGLFAAEAIASICLITLPAYDLIRPLMLTVLMFCAMAMQIRSFPYGFTGADRMRLIVLGALWIRELASGSQMVTDVCLWCIALHCCVSYVTPGLTKLMSADWQTGAILRDTAHHHAMGHPGLAAFLERYPANARHLAWSVLLLQATFPLALLDSRICVVYLFGMLSFHVGVAVLLGLNRFVWSWASTYPAVLYVVTITSNGHLFHP